ncbi:NAD(P)/FAD-dependent oxidoreductase [Streptomyces sp. NPDC054975]
MERSVDVLVVGAGPAGLASAARLASLGAGRYRVEVVEREQEAGGVPRHCGHGGFGLVDFGRPLDGPGYARRLARAARGAGATVRTGVSVTGWAGPLTLDVTAPTGLERITARAVVLATGARERPRSARLVPGTRPAGVLTTGELQQSVHLYGVRRERLGRRAVVIGAEPVAHHAVRALRGAQVDVVAMVTEQPHGLRRWERFPSPPLLTGATVTELVGRGRLTGVRVHHDDGRDGVIRCDTVVFTGDWIPEHEPARMGGVPLDAGTRGPSVDAAHRTATAGVFAAGNVLRGVESAGVAAAEGRAAADAVLRYLSGEPWPVTAVPVRPEGPVRWVAPNRLTYGTGPRPFPTADETGLRPFLLRAREPLARPLVEVVQGGRVLHVGRVVGTAWPHRSVRMAAGWAREVDPAGGPVTVRVRT